MKRSRRLILAALATVLVLAGAAPMAKASTLPLPAATSSSPATLQAPIPPGGGTIPIGTYPGGWGGLGGSGGDSITSASGACGYAAGNDAQGGVARPANLTCQGAGLVFVGPTTGQIATVIGPTIIGGAVGNVNVSAGNGAIGGPNG
ncbi:hypothetical protein [Candidatus Solirubrobacter pratensis]|uniref:hypothetical protein n=1 Tax=Candidatus Solirubrobacter pratensis TaxID=1298857 RepID=UPI0004081362|nr:hypothetical protein [Candidatus Solirubrobacter pratensis]